MLLEIPFRVLGFATVDYRWLLRHTSIALALAMGTWRAVRSAQACQRGDSAAEAAAAAVERIEEQLRVWP